MKVLAYLRDPNPYVLGIAVEERVRQLEPKPVIGVLPRRDSRVRVQFAFDGEQHVAWLTHD